MNWILFLMQIFTRSRAPEPEPEPIISILSAGRHAIDLEVSDGCYDLIKHFESLELESYPDPGSDLGKACTALRVPMREYRKIPMWQTVSGIPWTIGYGSTGPDVHQGMTISATTALIRLQDQTDQFAGMLRDQLAYSRVTQGQFDALTSFLFNLGPGTAGVKDGLFTLKSGGQSTLMRLTIAGEMTAAAEEFLKWTKAGGTIMAGLVRRREAERAMYLSQNWRQFIS